MLLWSGSSAIDDPIFRGQGVRLGDRPAPRNHRGVWRAWRLSDSPNFPLRPPSPSTRCGPGAGNHVRSFATALAASLALLTLRVYKLAIRPPCHPNHASSSASVNPALAIRVAASLRNP